MTSLGEEYATATVLRFAEVQMKNGTAVRQTDGWDPER